MKTVVALIALSFVLQTPGLLYAAEPAPADPNEALHQELRAFRDQFVAALNKKDIDQILTHLDENVVVTFQNAEVARGHEGVRKNHSRMLTGPDKVVDEYTAQLNVDELTILHGDTGISFGSGVEHFKLTNGMKFDLQSRWTATLLKKNGRWVVTSLHASTNMFDNPLLAAAKKTAYWVGGGGLLVGLLLGWIFTRRQKSKS